MRNAAVAQMLLASSVLAASLLPGGPSPAAGQARPPSAATARSTTTPADNVDSLLESLSSRDYHVREKAQDALVALGKGAVGPVERFARQTSNAEARRGAAAVLQRVKADRGLGPTFVTVNIPGATIQQTADELTRQGGIPVTIGTSDPAILPAPEAAPHQWPLAGIDVRHRPYWEAVHEVCAAFGARPSVMLPDGIELAPNPFWAKRPWRSVPGGLVVFESAERLSDRDARVVRDPRRRIRLRFEFYPDPAYRGLTHTHYLNITEAIDEHGQSLVSKDNLAQSVSSGNGTFSFEAAVAQSPDAKMATRLVSLQATAGLLVQTKGARIEVDHIAAAREVVRSAAGVKLTVHSCDRIAGGWSVSVSAERAGMSPREWELARELFFPLGPRLLDDKGRSETWVLQGKGEDRKVGPDRVDGPVRFLHTEGPGAAARALAPANFIWDLPAETKALEIPIELKDLPLP
jgi:hypothetical protein